MVLSYFTPCPIFAPLNKAKSEKNNKNIFYKTAQI